MGENLITPVSNIIKWLINKYINFINTILWLINKYIITWWYFRIGLVISPSVAVLAWGEIITSSHSYKIKGSCWKINFPWFWDFEWINSYWGSMFSIFFSHLNALLTYVFLNLLSQWNVIPDHQWMVNTPTYLDIMFVMFKPINIPSLNCWENWQTNKSNRMCKPR